MMLDESTQRLQILELKALFHAWNTNEVGNSFEQELDLNWIL